MSNDKLLGTGTRILLVDGDEVVDFYTVIYYGDVDGNGTINAIDALAIVKNKNGQIPFLDEVYEEAARITGETEIPSAVDALAIVKHRTGKYTINQKHENVFKFFPNDYIWAVG
ncbi:MAG: hypothetical protein IKT41_02025 [Clostridia bacterium]|nr:hypothetical protein [Clostridia bacterium]